MATTSHSFYEIQVFYNNSNNNYYYYTTASAHFHFMPSILFALPINENDRRSRGQQQRNRWPPTSSALFQLILLLTIAIAGADGEPTLIGVGQHRITDGEQTVTISEGWNITGPGSTPKGYNFDKKCPISINENGDITVTYTKDGGGARGCGLDLIAKSGKALNGFTCTVAITNRDCSLSKGEGMKSARMNMLPFIHSVDYAEFARMSKSGSLQRKDASKCHSYNQELCKYGDDYQCRDLTTYAVGWGFGEGSEAYKPYLYLKPVGEPTDEPTLRYDVKSKIKYVSNYQADIFEPRTLTITSDYIDGVVSEADFRKYLELENNDCTLANKLYPFRSWKIINEGALNGRELLFFGLLANKWFRDYHDVRTPIFVLPKCSISITFSGKHYELLHQEFEVPTSESVDPNTDTTDEPTEDVGIGTEQDTSTIRTITTEAPRNYMVWIILGIIAGVAILLAIGVCIYFACLISDDDDDDEIGPDGFSIAENGAIASKRPGTSTAIGPTKGDKTKVDKKTTKTMKGNKDAAAAGKALKSTKAMKSMKAVKPANAKKSTKTMKPAKAMKSMKAAIKPTNKLNEGKNK